MEQNKFVEDFESAIDMITPNTLHFNSKFREMEGWDSMSALSLIAMVDSEYGVQVTGEELRNSQTVEDVFNVVQKKQNL